MAANSGSGQYANVNSAFPALSIRHVANLYFFFMCCEGGKYFALFAGRYFGEIKSTSWLSCGFVEFCR